MELLGKELAQSSPRKLRVHLHSTGKHAYLGQLNDRTIVQHST